LKQRAQRLPLTGHQVDVDLEHVGHRSGRAVSFGPGLHLTDEGQLLRRLEVRLADLALAVLVHPWQQVDEEQ
jgi:hypothetical protein